MRQSHLALAAAQEAFDLIWPFFLSTTNVFGDITKDVVNHLLDLLGTIGQLSALELLERLEIFNAKLYNQ